MPMCYEVRVTRVCKHDEAKAALRNLRANHPNARITMPTRTVMGVALDTNDLNEAQSFLVRANAQLAEV